jgi:hypothetical protein
MNQEGFPWNLIMRTAMKIYRDNPNLVIIGHKYLARYMNTKVRSTCCCCQRHLVTIQRSLRLKW